MSHVERETVVPDVSGADAGRARSHLTVHSLAVQPLTATHQIPDAYNSADSTEQHYFHTRTIGGMPTAQQPLGVRAASPQVAELPVHQPIYTRGGHHGSPAS